MIRIAAGSYFETVNNERYTIVVQRHPDARHGWFYVVTDHQIGDQEIARGQYLRTKANARTFARQDVGMYHRRQLNG